MIGPCTSYTCFRGSCIFHVSNIIAELRELIQMIIYTNLNYFCWRSNFKNSCFVFHRGFKHSKTIKARGLRPRAFISFLVFETPMKHSHSFLKYYFNDPFNSDSRGVLLGLHVSRLSPSTKQVATGNESVILPYYVLRMR